MRYLRYLPLVLLGLALGAFLAIRSPAHLPVPDFLRSAFPNLFNQQPLNSVPVSSELLTVLDRATYGKGLTRTLALLKGSTPDRHNTVRVLFYGQSITRQQWWTEVADDLRERYPHANLIFENRAIGGFDSPLLVRTAEHDLYSFYPDLLIFHVYGDENDYESIIANVRKRTTAEVALISDHVAWMPTGSESDDRSHLQQYEWHNRHSLQWLPQLAATYGCELIEIRRPWEQYLKDHQLQAEALLVDHVHLNEQGNQLMADLVKSHFRHLPASEPNISTDRVKDYRVGEEVQWQNGKLRFEFTGNRVDLISHQQKGGFRSAQILIDDRKPSEFSELYTFTRPSNVVGVEWPAILKVSTQRQPIAEDWMAVLTRITPDCRQFNFEVFGSETGFDGKGSSDRTFVSNSGRVVIEPKNWWIEKTCQETGEPLPTGFQVRWQARPLFTDVFVAQTNADPTREGVKTVAQNLSNTRHLLEVRADGDRVAIDSIRVYHP